LSTILGDRIKLGVNAEMYVNEVVCLIACFPHETHGIPEVDLTE